MIYLRILLFDIFLSVPHLCDVLKAQANPSRFFDILLKDNFKNCTKKKRSNVNSKEK